VIEVKKEEFLTDPEGGKLSDREIEIAYDLGMHAGKQAMITLGRVLEMAEPKLAVATAIIADAYVLWALKAAVAAYSRNVMPTFTDFVSQAEKIIAEGENPRYQAFADRKAKELGLSDS
jgi:hypothetical protein